MLKYISLPLFITSLAIGLFVVYISSTPKNIIYVYPTPDNVHVQDTHFKDNADICFRFNVVETVCPSDQTKIKRNIPNELKNCDKV